MYEVDCLESVRLTVYCSINDYLSVRLTVDSLRIMLQREINCMVLILQAVKVTIVCIVDCIV